MFDALNFEALLFFACKHFLYLLVSIVFMYAEMPSYTLREFNFSDINVILKSIHTEIHLLLIYLVDSILANSF